MLNMSDSMIELIHPKSIDISGEVSEIFGIIPFYALPKIITVACKADFNFFKELKTLKPMLM